MANRVVSDSSPIIALSDLNRLNLLLELFGDVAVLPAVIGETVSAAPLPRWIHEVELTQPIDPQILIAGLGPGESAAIHLALETNPPWLILDDRPARRLAISLGIPVIGTLGILLAAKRKGLLTTLKPVLNALMQTGFFVAPALYRHTKSSVSSAWSVFKTDRPSELDTDHTGDTDRPQCTTAACSLIACRKIFGFTVANGRRLAIGKAASLLTARTFSQSNLPCINQRRQPV